MKEYSFKRFGVFKKIILILLMLLVIFAIIKIYLSLNNLEIGVAEAEEIENTKIEENQKEVTEIIEDVSECVVGISKLKDNGVTIFLEGSGEQLGIGTGMIISENGYILTNQHVSGNKYSNCYVTLANGREYLGNVVWADKNIDLAIVKINAKALSFLTLGDSDKIKVGEEVYAIGNPIGFEFQRTVTSGIISAKNRTIKIEENGIYSYLEDLIQTDATINLGNSGGPLINRNGEVIGVNSIKITSAEGIGFAMPINMIKTVIGNFLENDKFEEASIGIFAYDKEVIPYLDENIKFENGIYVADVTVGGPAYYSNIQVGDIIIAIDKIELNKMSELRQYIYNKKPGDSVNLKVLRNKELINIKVKLGNKI